MNEPIKFHFNVDGEDFTSAGEASVNVKKLLRQMNVAPDIIKRVSIAMYEGEINMVIHADGGNADVYLPKTEIIPLDSLTAYMQKHELCELRLIEANPKIKYCHRRKDNENLYFFVSEDINNDISQKIELKGFSGGDYIIYDSLTNEISRSFSSDGLIELKLHPYQSLMVITGVECKDIPVKKHRKKVIEKDFFDYSLSLAIAGEEFAKYKELSSPVNVTGANEAKDFSGYMKYEGTFTIDNQGDYEIDLGKVGEVAEVFVNGIKVGERICPPYSFDVTKAINPGMNMLEVNVANTLVFQKKDNFSRLFAVEPSGLLSRTKLYRFIDEK